MRRLKAASFSEQWKRSLGWQKETRVAVLFETRWDWEILPEHFRESFIWHFQVSFLEIEAGRQGRVEEQLNPCMETLREWRTEALVAIGEFYLLQKVCLLRERLHGENGERIPVLLLSGKDRWQDFFGNMLWMRGGNGETDYWGYVGGHEKDALVMTQDGEFQDFTPDAFEQGMDVLRSAFWETDAVFGITGTEGREGEKTKRTYRYCGMERDICRELAEPLRVLYGIPMETGSYFALLYLYRLLPEQRKKKICEYCGRFGISGGHAGWQLERLADRYRRDWVSGILIPRGDVPVLTQMAMEGIENHPVERQIGWEQVSSFYGELCR